MNKFIFIALAAISFFSIKCANEEKWLKPRDYYQCEQKPYKDDDEFRHLNFTICNDRWSPTKNGGSVYTDYKCCYVQFKMGDLTQKGCYIVQDSKTGKKKYKQRALAEMENIDIICH